MTNSQLFLDWHCAIADISLTSGQAWTEVVNPRPPSLNALHNAFCLCAPAATHKNSLAQTTDVSPPLVIVLPSLSSSCALLYIHSTLRSQHSPLTTSILLIATTERHSRTLLPLRTIEKCIWFIPFALAHMQQLLLRFTFWSRVRAPHDACLTRCSLRSVLLLLQHWSLCTSDHQRFAGSCTCHKQRITNINSDGASESDMRVTVTVRTV